MEQELKIKLLSAEDYASLSSFLGKPEKELQQSNFYLDIPPDMLLQKLKIMARIRQQGSSLRMTVKWDAIRNEGYFQAQEEEADLGSSSSEEAIQNNEAKKTLQKLCPLVELLPLDRLGIVGSMTNLRKVYSIEGFKLELDHTHFGKSAEDWEIELETDQPGSANQFLHGLLQKANVAYKPQTLTKYERFLNHQARRGS